MILNTGDKKLKVIREVSKSEINDVYVCEEVGSSIRTYHTIWMIKNREIAKKLLEYDQYECFCIGEMLCFCFPYEEPRPIQQYYQSVTENNPALADCIYRDCVVSCMAADIPYPVLRLMLKQGQIYLAKDGSIHFGYLLDLGLLRFETTETECARQCAKLILDLLFMSKGNNKAAITLLEQKCYKNVYRNFMELLADIRIFTGQTKKEPFLKKLKTGINSQRDKTFHILCVICVILLVVVLVMLLMNLFLGDTAFYQLFTPAIEKIGTESLLQ